MCTRSGLKCKSGTDAKVGPMQKWAFRIMLVQKWDAKVGLMQKWAFEIMLVQKWGAKVGCKSGRHPSSFQRNLLDTPKCLQSIPTQKAQEEIDF